MLENGDSPAEKVRPEGEPTAQTCVRVARQAAELATAAHGAPAPAVAAEETPKPVADAPTCPTGLYLVPLMSTRFNDWYGLECGRCVPGVRTSLPGKWDDKGNVYAAAHTHYGEAHRPADEALTADELEELEVWTLSDAQYTVLSWAERGQLYEDPAGFVGMDVSPDRADVNKNVSRGRATGLWAAGLLTVHPDCPNRRRIGLSETGRRVLRLLWRAARQGDEAASKDAKLAPLPKRSSPYPLLSNGQYFKGEERPEGEPLQAEPAPAPLTAVPAPRRAALREGQSMLRRLFAPSTVPERQAQHDIRTVIRRPQRTLTPEEDQVVRGTALLNLHGALIMGLVDPVPNTSPMSEEEGAWVREHIYPVHLQAIDRKYPWGFHRWSTCERGTCWNCLAGRCDLCVHRQKGGPDVDDNTDWVHNQKGHCVAKLILRPDGEPCSWWCRCPCPKDGPVPARPSASAVEPAVAADTAPTASATQDHETNLVQAGLW